MFTVSLPDGSSREFENELTALEVCQTIGAGLAKAMLAAEVDGVIVDAHTKINKDITLKVITAKDKEGVEIVRHSTAHLLAHAVKSLFPDVQVTIGPVIDNGFYYDFLYPKGFSDSDFAAIEDKMNEIIKRNLHISRQVLARDDAVKFFKDIGEDFKAEIIASIPQSEDVSLYEQGDFTDLCRGPHVPNTSCLGAFKLTKVSGAYWRGDSSNVMLQRIYGTAWSSEKELRQYLHMLEEAKKRDHRPLGAKMGLFHMQKEAPGMIFWHPNGWKLYQNLISYVRKINTSYGYKEVCTPQLLDKDLWEKSGHWDKFHENMYVTAFEDKEVAIKPMNCPGHVQIFNQGLISYKNLPLRFSEFGSCHRKEPSGSLHGIMRVRNFVQDDGHIFCTPSQVKSEVGRFIEQVYSMYEDLGFKEVVVKLSTRPEKRVGSDDVWDKAEAELAEALDENNISWDLQPGEGAFYGPKIEFVLKDCIGRFWQCGTLQLDFSMPERLGATYVNSDSKKETPVMIHRAVLGSIERFVGILIEEYSGYIPFWLAPVQIVVANISASQIDYVCEIVAKLRNLGFNVVEDARNENIGYKIREHSISRVPYVLVCGDKEVSSNAVTVRDGKKGEVISSMSLDDFVASLPTKSPSFVNLNKEKSGKEQKA
jgi:threonyl-tRNA synthetase